MAFALVCMNLLHACPGTSGPVAYLTLALASSYRPCPIKHQTIGQNVDFIGLNEGFVIGVELSTQDRLAVGVMRGLCTFSLSRRGLAGSLPAAGDRRASINAYLGELIVDEVSNGAVLSRLTINMRSLLVVSLPLALSP